ncbi:MAG: sugar kinase [Candidatus Lokiarchaeota archaeon]|nr:sugar kinase [Candidatus Lokiarchaeota archaeon]
MVKKPKFGNYVVALGELMLRLKSPLTQRFLQNSLFEATFGGAEANFLASLSNYNVPTRYITCLPDNDIAKNALRFLHSLNIDTSCISFSEGRMGLYYLEQGSGPRPSQVIYDRAYSSISQSKINQFQWDAVFADSSWFHTTGITAALSQNTADLCEYAMKEATKRNMKISCDLNYRKNLWNYGKTPKQIMKKLLSYVNVVIANEEDIQNTLELDRYDESEKISAHKYQRLAENVVDEFPNIEVVAITLRESFSADYNEWAALCYVSDHKKVYISQKYQLKNIIDRVGAGDAFGAGFIYGLLMEKTYQEALEFGVAASALKHTIPGDINRVTAQEVENLIGGTGSGRVVR